MARFESGTKAHCLAHEAALMALLFIACAAPRALAEDSSAGAASVAIAIFSNPTAAPNPAQAEQNVSFSVAANSTEGVGLTYAWDFGDGSRGAGSACDHTFNRSGNYSVAVAVSDGAHHSYASLTVAVLASRQADVCEKTASRAVAKPAGNIVSGRGMPASGGVIAISGGNNYALALKNDGTVLAWGTNTSGELGDGIDKKQNTPAPVHGLSGVASISAGDGQSLALKNDGTVWGWGANDAGQLGLGTVSVQKTPVQISSLTGIAAIAAGADYSLALAKDGTVWACGSNYGGQLGDGTFTASYTPVQVYGPSNITAIAAGESYALALQNDGTVWQWGLWPDSAFPYLVAGLNNVAAIATGYDHCLALKNDGTVWAWGCNDSGQLGDGEECYENSNTPVQAIGLTNIVAISAGQSQSLALKNDGTVWAWGLSNLSIMKTRQNYKELLSSTPIQVPNLSGIIAVSEGAQQSLVLKNDASVWEWGILGYRNRRKEICSTKPKQIIGPNKTGE
jgi:alpha-tubulin suppressor-like RCC1 family protein